MTIRFEKSGVNFLSVLRKKVNTYFTENKISPFGNRELYMKTIILAGLLLVNYVFQFS